MSHTHLLKPIPKPWSPPEPTPGHKIPADIQEDEEALIVGRVGAVRSKSSLHLPHGLEIKHQQVNLLCNGWWLHGVSHHGARGPGTAIHIQVPKQGYMLGTSMLLDTGPSVVPLPAHQAHLLSGDRPMPMICPCTSMTWSSASKKASEPRPSPSTGPAVVIWCGRICLMPAWRPARVRGHPEPARTSPPGHSQSKNSPKSPQTLSTLRHSTTVHPLTC